MVNVGLTHIPYQGSAPAVAAMLGGHVSMMIGALPDVLPHVQAGKMRAIAVAMDRRTDTLKDLPTVSEAGVKGFDSWSWFGMVTASGVPREIVNRIAAEMNKQLRVVEVRERLDGLALYYMESSPEEFGAVIKDNFSKYARVIKTANIKID
ncbi:MAG: Bug family tripartite tricarboxylate transporter substrate binding protein [Burkholderiales bacterium]